MYVYFVVKIMLTYGKMIHDDDQEQRCNLGKLPLFSIQQLKCCASTALLQ